ncbi:MAG TPA: HlyD family secretion protein [Roseiarcus sp.]|nr:HlyD family secretion protein [Roseiarcus sp.]
MSGVEANANTLRTAPAIKRGSVLSSLRVLPVLITAAAVCLAAALAVAAWQYYMGAPWTRDGTVRAYVVKIAPQVAGEIVQLPIADNQFVHKGDLLMLIDPRNYSIAVRQAQAAAQQAQAVADNATAEMARREKLNDIAVTMEERQTYISRAATAEASYQSALANLDQARINFKRTQVRSPVNGFITNLTAQLGDYANVGALQLSVVNSDSYWVDAYFEETALGRIHEGDAATIKLMGYSAPLRGRVQGLSRGINVPNATPDASGLASVNPIFTFVRLAQRVPVRIKIDEVPEGVKLVAGLTATVQIEPRKAPPIPGSKLSSAGVSEAAPGQFQTLLEAARRAPSQGAPQAAGPHAASPPAPIQPQSPSPASSADELAVSAPPSAQASAAAAAAAADLKALEEQIAANPPSGAVAPPAAAARQSEASPEMTATNEYLGQTFDLYGDPGAKPAPKPRSPQTIRRRARSRWRHY